MNEWMNDYDFTATAMLSFSTTLMVVSSHSAIPIFSPTPNNGEENFMRNIFIKLNFISFLFSLSTSQICCCCHYYYYYLEHHQPSWIDMSIILFVIDRLFFEMLFFHPIISELLGKVIYIHIYIDIDLFTLFFAFFVFPFSLSIHTKTNHLCMGYGWFTFEMVYKCLMRRPENIGMNGWLNGQLNRLNNKLLFYFAHPLPPPWMSYITPSISSQSDPYGLTGSRVS